MWTFYLLSPRSLARYPLFGKMAHKKATKQQSRKVCFASEIFINFSLETTNYQSRAKVKTSLSSKDFFAENRLISESRSGVGKTLIAFAHASRGFGIFLAWHFREGKKRETDKEEISRFAMSQEEPLRRV